MFTAFRRALCNVCTHVFKGSETPVGEALSFGIASAVGLYLGLSGVIWVRQIFLAVLFFLTLGRKLTAKCEKKYLGNVP